MNEDLDELRRKKAFVLDMDGTFYLGNQLIRGALEFIRQLKSQQKEPVFFTNNSSHSRAFYQQKIQRMGLDDHEVPVYTAGDVLAYYLHREHPGAKVYVVGTDSLAESLRGHGIILANQDVDVVAVGFDTSLVYQKIENACTLLRLGAAFIATNPDLNCPVEKGFLPDCGSICAMIEAATGKKPFYLGKPFSPALEYLVAQTGFRPAEMVIVGDRLYTDIAFGQKYGITTVLVLSGETSRKDLQEEKNAVYQPTFVLPSLRELAAIL
ncbi:MAG: HAD-IIA family hydrolase [Peptococcia bacterium]|jgi:4-nitrophenyl phosphatase